MDIHRSALVIIVFSLLFSSLAFAQTEVEGGEVFGTWNSEGSPYIVINNITVTEEDSLIIMPGVEVRFPDRYSLIVNGYLSAVGAENDSIVFGPVEEDGRWNGVRLINAQDSSHISYCVFTNGQATDGGDEFNEAGSGGNLFINGESIVIVENSRFSNGIARSMGGGIGIWSASPVIRNCVISDNFSYYLGAGIGNTVESSPQLENVQILNNRSDNDGQRYGGGGGMYVGYSSNPTINNCNFIGNSYSIRDGGGGALYISNGSEPVVTNCTFDGNLSEGRSGDGGAVSIRYEASPVFRNCAFINNESTDSGGSFYIRGENIEPLIENCYFNNNTVSDGDRDGGALYIREQAQVEVRYCTFENNVADWGGAITVKEPPRCLIHHCLFHNNGSRNGGSAISTTDDLGRDPLIITNCTLVDQTFTGIEPRAVTAAPRGDSRLIFENCIIWDPDPKFPEEANIEISYSQVRNGFEGEGNSEENPGFYGHDDPYYLLRPDSPCIDTGDPEYPVDPDETRIDKGWMYFPQNVMQGFEGDTLRTREELLTNDLDTLHVEYTNVAEVPIYVQIMDYWNGGAREAMVNLTGLTGDTEIHGVAYTQGDFYVVGSNNNIEPNKIYCLDMQFNFCRRMDQPGDRGGLGYLDLTADSFDLLYGANGGEVMEFTVEGEVGDPYDIHYDMQPLIETPRAIAMDIWNPYSWTDFYLTGDEGFIVRTDADLWERDRIQVGDTVFGMVVRPNSRALYIVTEPEQDKHMLSLLYPDDHKVIPLYELRLFDDHNLGGLTLTQDWDTGITHLVGILTGEGENGDWIWIEQLYTSWMVIKPETRMLKPGESTTWDICVTPDQVPAGRYVSQFDLKFNDIGSLDYQVPVMMLSEEPPDTGNVVIDDELLPTEPTLGDIYPNPFNSTATFKYQLPTNAWLRINLYDAQGRKIQELVNGFRKAGSYTGLIHANTLPSGEYFLKFMSGGEVQVKSVLLVK